MPNITVWRPPFVTRGQWKWIPTRSLSLGTCIGSGGIKIGGSVSTNFTHGPAVSSNVSFFWDFDNDNDFSASVEDITSYVMSAETKIGRDWPSQINGKAGPGQLRMTLNNQDGRFSYFNTNSPLATTPFSLRTGRKVRVQTDEVVTDPDPTILAIDRFRRSNGALGSTENGLVWTTGGSPFVVNSQVIKPTIQGNKHFALVDVSTTDYYVQIEISDVGRNNSQIGIVFQYQDDNNYSKWVVIPSAFSSSTLFSIDVVAGVSTLVGTLDFEAFDGIVLGVRVTGSTYSAYVNGVDVGSTGPAPLSNKTKVGVFADWQTVGTMPATVSSFRVWDGLPVTTSGVIWTGDVSDLTETVAPGPLKRATVSGEGRLGRLAAQSVDLATSALGRFTGFAIGEALASANLLSPPGSIDAGDISTGSYAFDSNNSLEAARQFEETEFGFLYESQEGYVEFDSRSARDSATSVTLFSDVAGSQYTYTVIEPLNWSREIVNRVIAGVAPTLPGNNGEYDELHESGTSVDVTMPSGIGSGDLLIVAVAYQTGTPASSSLLWTTPAGWVEFSLSGQQTLTDGFTGANNLKLWAKVADGTESLDVLTFVSGATLGVGDDTAVSKVLLFLSGEWFGTLQDGIQVGEYATSGDPDVMFPSWGTDPCVFIDMFWSVFTSGFTFGGPTVDFSNSGYYAQDFEVYSSVGAQDISLIANYRSASTPVENPSAATITYFPSTPTNTYEGNVLIAVRGFNGDPPVNNGRSLIQVDDTDSQDEHNVIITHTNPSELFSDSTDAATYANLVLDTFSDDRPILRISFIANKSASYRYQALTRRINDKITIVANNNSGLGISGDFFIESINHRFSNGNKLWEVTWELSPA